MNNALAPLIDQRCWLNTIKLQAALVANRELLPLYYEIGARKCSRIINALHKDLQQLRQGERCVDV